LSPRQLISFGHLADLYRPTRTYAADNKPSAEGYVLAYAGVRCRFEIKQSTDLATVVGRLEGDQVETTDGVHFSEDQEIDDNWLILNRSLQVDGSPDGNFGRFWIVRGQPQKFSRSANRQGGKIVVKASQEKNPPLGLV
jgi:hypothetical protein